MAGPTREFWQKRFQADDTPWDRGAANPQLAAWLSSGTLNPCRILVPGCGSGHEVAVLAAAGFEVTALDYAPAAIDRTRKLLVAAGLKATLVEADALAWRPERAFDAIYEQTCLCALYPDQWRGYADQLHRWTSARRKTVRALRATTQARRRGRLHRRAALSLRHQRHARAVSRGPLVVAEAALPTHVASTRVGRTCRDFGPAKLSQTSSMRSR